MPDEPSLLLLGIAGPSLTAEEIARFRRLRPAGYIFFSRNITDPAQTRRLTDDLRDLTPGHNPILAIDQEGGRVCRTSALAPDAPSPPELVACADPPLRIAESAAFTADLLRLLGFNMNLAPVLDLDHHPSAENALRGRCWGRDAQRVIDHAGVWNRWLRRRSVAGCAKHFPAGGRACSDPHHELPASRADLGELLREDILPYTALMPELDAIMLAHVEFPAIDPDLPASLSPRIIRDFLRGQLGFERHVVMTDDLDMAAVTRRFGRGPDARLAIEAGNDLALICHQTASAELAAREIAALPAHRIDESLERLHGLEKKLHGPLLWSQEHWEKTVAELAALAARVAEESAARLGVLQAATGPVAEY